MATVKQVEQQIKRLEGFGVRLLDSETGRDVRSDRDLGNIATYQSRYRRMARNGSSVTEWIETRFKPNYPGFDAKVVMANGTRAHGNFHLGTVRDSYLGP
jgi:hypothetical protein